MPYALISNLEAPLLLVLIVITTVWLVFRIRSETKTGIARGRYGLQINKNDNPQGYRNLMISQYAVVVFVIVLLGIILVRAFQLGYIAI